MSTDADIVKRFATAQDALVLQSSDLSLETIASMVDSKAIDVAPQYQRRERWPTEAQSELIESFLLNVPVPPVYLAEDDFGTYSVIDGKQRITTIQKFLRNQLTLTPLPKFKEVSGMKFEQLPKPLQNALSIRPYLRVVTLLKQTDPDLKYEVFTRLNTGGRPLLPQEIRNAVFRGPLNDTIFALAKTPFLLQQLKIEKTQGSAYTEMQDVEIVLRFLALSSEWSAFGGDYRRSMDGFMARNRHANARNLASVKKKFITAITRCEKLWGASAFRRYAGNAFRDQFLAAVYDAQMIAVSEISTAMFDRLSSEKPKIARATKALFTDTKFEEAVRTSTNTSTRVKYRVEAVLGLLQSI